MGGSGAGGGGGMSVGVLEDVAGVWSPASGVTYVLGAAGPGGAGGWTGAPAGQPGLHQDVYVMP